MTSIEAIGWDETKVTDGSKKNAILEIDGEIISSSKAGRKMADFLPQIDPSRCTGCEVCIKVCPNEVLTLTHKLAIVANPEACDYTGACQESCPTKAISLIYEIVCKDITPAKHVQKQRCAENGRHPPGTPA